MTEERDTSDAEGPVADERADTAEHAEDAPKPFDQNPPVNPSEPQVGNSRARFFMPRAEGEGDEEDEQSEEAREGDGREGGA
jgi:hypothetical protein